MKSLLAIALLLLGTAAQAQTECQPKGDLCIRCPAGQVKYEGECWTPNSIYALPPPEYSKPWAGQVVETIAYDREDLDRLCAPQPQKGGILGCAHRSGSDCVISIAPLDVLKKRDIMIEAVRRHEIAHCNGWHHPKPRSLDGNGKGEAIDPYPPRPTPDRYLTLIQSIETSPERHADVEDHGAL